MITYNKLVRDKIPEIIEKDGKKAITKLLTDEEFKVELRKKAHEELAEYMKANTDQESIEELADLLEIVYSLANVHGATIADLEKVRKEKVDKRGGFQKNIYLIGVEDEES